MDAHGRTLEQREGPTVPDRWRRPSAEEHASAVTDALARTGLPADLAEAAVVVGSVPAELTRTRTGPPVLTPEVVP